MNVNGINGEIRVGDEIAYPAGSDNGIVIKRGVVKEVRFYENYLGKAQQAIKIKPFRPKGADRYWHDCPVWLRRVDRVVKL